MPAIITELRKQPCGCKTMHRSEGSGYPYYNWTESTWEIYCIKHR